MVCRGNGQRDGVEGSLNVLARHSPKKSVGKRVRGATYVHASALPELDECNQALVNNATARAVDFRWNVAKVSPEAVSLLLYEDFDAEAFPALLASVRVDLGTGRTNAVDYRKRANPPILHRKEELLLLDDPRRPRFAALTRAAEEHGLFREPTKIGNRLQWRGLVNAANLRIDGQNLVPIGLERVEVARHRTAIARHELSQPLQLVMANAVLTSGDTVFDYGCGQGDDVAALSTNGFEAFGWDPHHAADGPRRPADVVNLGFVLNVVEDRHERLETLKSAWSFARRALAVAVMTTGKVSSAGLRPYLDGHVTSRGTFQKYFAQQELRDFIEEAIGEAPVALGPGVFVAFRDKNLEQEVLLRRRSRTILRPVGMRAPNRLRASAPHVRLSLSERVRPELEMLWAAMVERGRILDLEEFPEAVQGPLQEARVSATRATEVCLSDIFDQSELTAAAASRREDLLVHFALTLFPGAPCYASLPRSIQRDVRAFFGSHAAALEAARDLLFSTGKPRVARTGVDLAVAGGLGAWRNEQTFRFHAPAINRLPAVLRVLVGCAGVLRGGVEGADFVDIKLEGPRVVFIACMDPTARLPIIAERTRVDLARLRSTVEKPDGTVLYLKGRFLPADAPEREDQTAFDNKLLSTGVVSGDGRGPRLPDLREAIRQGRLDKGLNA
jgi:DNA phosphorothioation-associated putative methyltransferase